MWEHEKEGKEFNRQNKNAEDVWHRNVIDNKIFLVNDYAT